MVSIDVSFGNNECGAESKVHISLSENKEIVLTTQNFGDDMVWLEREKVMELILALQQALTVAYSLRDRE